MLGCWHEKSGSKAAFIYLPTQASNGVLHVFLVSLEVLQTCQLDIRLIDSSIPHPLLHLSIPSLTILVINLHIVNICKYIVASSFSLIDLL